MPAASPLTILHVSDMQFGKNHRFSSEDPNGENSCHTLLNKLCVDLDWLREHEKLEPDLLICTGDLAETGMKKEFDAAFEFLDGLAKHIGLGRDRIVVIPGNHDFNWHQCQAHFSNQASNDQLPALPYWEKYGHYKTAFDEFFKDCKGVSFTKERPWTLFEFEKLHVAVAGLNSTWKDRHGVPKGSKEKVEHFGWCGEPQYADFASQLGQSKYFGWLRIGAVHHNVLPGWMGDTEGLHDTPDLSRYLGDIFHLLLHGHTHNSSAQPLTLKLMVYGTGSSALKKDIRPDEVPNQYQILQIAPKHIKRFLRCYQPGKKAWEADTSAAKGDGNWKLTDDLSLANVGLAFPNAPRNNKTNESNLFFVSHQKHSGSMVSVKEFNEAIRRINADEILSRIASACALRHPGAQIEVRRRHADELKYLFACLTDDLGRHEFIMGARGELPTSSELRRFDNSVGKAWRAGQPQLLIDYIVDLPEPLPQPLLTAASKHGLRLRTLADYQTLYDFRAYASAQAEELASLADYKPGLYVGQRLTACVAPQPFVVGKESGEPVPALETIRGWLLEPAARFILVLGDFGVGKTFLLRRLAADLAALPGAPSPIVVELRELQRAGTLEMLVAQHFARPGQPPVPTENILYMLREGRIVLFFDAFDELAVRIGHDEACRHLETLVGGVTGRARILLTSRTGHFFTSGGDPTSLGRLATGHAHLAIGSLRRFEPDQVRQWLRNYFQDEEKAEEWYCLIEHVEKLLDLSNNPRMLSFIVQLDPERLKAVRARQGAISAAELYRLLILEHWLPAEVAKTKLPGGGAVFTVEQLYLAVTALALRLWRCTDQALAAGDFPSAAADILRRVAPDRAGEEMDFARQVGSRSLLVPSEEGRLTFLHQSVLEWLVADRIAEDLKTAGHSENLGGQRMSDLMLDFLHTLAGEKALAWAERAGVGSPKLDGGEIQESSTEIENAVRFLIRHTGTLARHKRAPLNLAGQDLRSLDLTNFPLAGANLQGCNLQGMVLTGRDFSEANLAGANLTGAICDGAKFIRAGLKNVKASGCSALGANFTDARMVGGIWRRARLVGAHLTAEQQAGMDLWGAAGEHREAVEPRWPALASGVNSVAWSPDGTLLASGYDDGTVRLHDAESGRELRVLQGHGGRVWSVAWSADGSRLASGAIDNTVRLWEAASGRELRVLEGHGGSVLSVAWSADGSRLASGSDDNTVRLWEAASGRELRVLEGHGDRVLSVAWSADGSRLASGSDDNTVRLWEAASGRELRVLAGHSGYVRALAWNPDGSRLASGSDDNTVRLWEAASGRELRVLEGHGDRVLSVAWSADGSRLASGSGDRTVRLWEAASGRELRVLEGHGDWVLSVAWSADGSRLASGSDDNTVRLWEAASGRELRVLAGHSGYVRALAWNPDGSRLASGSDDQTVRLWEVGSGRELCVLKGQGDSVWSVAWSADLGRLVSGYHNGIIRLWEMASGRELRVLTGHGGGVLSVAWDAGGSRLASGSDDRTVRLWEVGSGRELRVLAGHSGYVRALAWNPDGSRLASGSDDQTVRLWEVGSGRELRVLAGHSGYVRALAWNPDGSRLASGSDDQTVRLWEAASGRELCVLKGHRSGVRSVAWHADGAWLASGADDNTVRLWEAASGRELGIGRHPSGAVQQVAWNRDGRWLLSGGSDGTLRVWDTAGLPSKPPARGSRTTIKPAQQPALPCVAVLFATGDGWIAARADGRFRFGGDATKMPFFGSGLCRFTPAEVAAFSPERLLADGEPLLPGSLHVQ